MKIIISNSCLPGTNYNLISLEFLRFQLVLFIKLKNYLDFKNKNLFYLLMPQEILKDCRTKITNETTCNYGHKPPLVNS